MYQPPNNNFATASNSGHHPLFVERRSPTRDKQSLALLALSHTRVENELYIAMLNATRDSGTTIGEFSIQRLMDILNDYSYSTIRRSLIGLQQKMSIERIMWSSVMQRRCGVYRVYAPGKVFTRRRSVGQAPFPKELNARQDSSANLRAIERVVEYHNLTRREAQIALCCIEGMTNGEIGEKLFVSEQTVKSHLRNVFSKMGIKRRTELVSRLLMAQAM